MISHDDLAHLAYLIGFGLIIPGLQIQDFDYAFTLEYVMIAPDMLDKTEVLQHLPQIIKTNIGIRCPAQYLCQSLFPGCQVVIYLRYQPLHMRWTRVITLP